MSSPHPRARKTIRHPSGFEDHVSRREAAALLGFASEFKVRQLERGGRLVPVRGIMGSAWYPRAAVLALREPPRPRLAEATPAITRSWSDAALIDHLRHWTASDPARHRPPTTVDLVAETGISIARAERVFRFWITQDLHPAAETARAGRSPSKSPATATAPPAVPGAAPRQVARVKGERRSGERMQRDALLRELKHPDPRVRAAAFARLKQQGNPAKAS